MWERKSELGTWNGIVLNILSTTLDDGKRLHVAEMPYVDLPYIKVMGSQSSGFTIEVIYVGADSLANANTLLNELSNNPKGILDHPYLGELSLVYETSSKSFTTKKGLVTLSLKFLRQGKEINISVNSELPINTLADNVNDQSSAKFVDVVASSDADTLSNIQVGFYSLVNRLRNIANRSGQNSAKLAKIHRQIEDAVTAIGVIKAAPETLSGHLSAITGSMKSKMDDDKETSDIKAFQVYSNSELVIEELSQSIVASESAHHCNMSATIAIIKMNSELLTISGNETISSEVIKNTTVEKIEKNFDVIQALMTDREKEITAHATFESLELVAAFEALAKSIDKQQSKFKKYKQSLIEINVPRHIPLLSLAHRYDKSSASIGVVNQIEHPLFVIGKVSMENG